jgi:very-short-patch-repair endonuclease
VVDFCCPAAKLVVEVDGESHEDPEADVQRTVYLESEGLKVFRVTNDQVLHQRLAVMDAILSVTEERLRQLQNPHPSPLPERERE